MASPLRSSQKAAVLGPGHGNSIRKSFNVNLFPKTPSRNNTHHSVFTPANSPADYPGRASSPFKDLRQSEEIKEIDFGVENVRPKFVKSPSAKGIKNFMAPTFSAASKAAAAAPPKKRVLADRNDVGCLAKTPAKSPSVVSKSLDSNPIESEDRVLLEGNGARVSAPEPKEKSESLSFLAQFPDPDEEISSPLPPYDPKKNYLSPRPQFLRYRPNRGLDFDDVAEVEGLDSDKGFKPEILSPTPTPCESEVTEIKVESLGERMAAVGITVDEKEVVGCVDISEEIQGKLITETCGEQGFCSPDLEFEQEGMCNPGVGFVQEGVCNTNLGFIQQVVGNPKLEFEDKKNIHVEEMDEEDGDDDEEEEQKQNSGWLRRGLVFAFVFLCASVSLLASGSPGLLPPSLHDNALARGYSEMKSEEIVKNMKDWLDFYSVIKPGMQAKSSSMQDVLQDSLDTKDVEVSGEGFGKSSINSPSLSSEVFEDTVGVRDIWVEESSTESIMEPYDPIYFSLGSTEEPTDVDGAEEVSQILDPDYIELDVNPEYEEILGTLEEVSYFTAHVEIEQDTFTFGRRDDSFPEVHSEEAQIITEHDSVEDLPGISDADEVLSSESCEDSQFSEVSYSLNMQSRASGTPTGEAQSYQAEDFESTESNEKSISQAKDTVPVPEESSMSSAEDDLKGSEVQDSVITERSTPEVPLSETTAVMSILVAILIASIYFISSSRKKSKTSSEDVTRKSSVEFIGKEAQQPMEKPYYAMNFSSPKMSPQVEFLTEYLPEESSSSDRHPDQRNDQGTFFQTYERRSRRAHSCSSVSPQDYAVTSEFSSESPSYGSFTTYEKIARKEGGGEEEPKVMKVVTPVRRSSRLRKHQAVSPR